MGQPRPFARLPLGLSVRPSDPSLLRAPRPLPQNLSNSVSACASPSRPHLVTPVSILAGQAFHTHLPSPTAKPGGIVTERKDDRMCLSRSPSSQPEIPWVFLS